MLGIHQPELPEIVMCGLREGEVAGIGILAVFAIIDFSRHAKYPVARALICKVSSKPSSVKECVKLAFPALRMAMSRRGRELLIWSTKSFTLLKLAISSL